MGEKRIIDPHPGTNKYSSLCVIYGPLYISNIEISNQDLDPPLSVTKKNNNKKTYYDQHCYSSKLLIYSQCNSLYAM